MLDKKFISLTNLKNLIDDELSNEGSNKEPEIGRIDSSNERDIAVVGISCRFATAKNLEQYWEILKNGKECVRELPPNRKIDVDKYMELNEVKEIGVDVQYKKAAYLDNVDYFDYDFFGISPNEAKYMDPNQKLFLEEAYNALEDAGYGGEKLVGTKTGIFVGVDSENNIGHIKMLEKVDPSLFNMLITGNLKSIMSSRLAYLIDLKGPTAVVDTACSSSLVALHLACRALKNGDCDAVLVGGINTDIYPNIKSDNLHKMGIESSDNKTKTFDDSSDGTSSGEGVAAILIKKLDKAIKDNDNIYAVIKGSAINQDGASVSITAPNVKSQENVILDAWKDANIDPSTISYIEAHGTGTKLGDPIEIKAIHNAFSKFTNKKQFCAIGSVKTNIGHTNSLSGLAGLIKAILSIKHKRIPASLNFKVPNRNINFTGSPVYINDRFSIWTSESGIYRCGVSSFGMSGTNSHVVLESPPKIHNSNEVLEENLIMTISAGNKTSLERLIKRYTQFLFDNEKVNLADVCYTLNTGRKHCKYRECIVARNREELIEKLSDIDVDKLQEDQRKRNISEYSDELKKLAIQNIDSFTKSKEENIELLNRIAYLYKEGADIPWERMYLGKKRKKVSLPTYPFEKNRCWIEIPKSKSIEYRFMELFEKIQKNNLPSNLAKELTKVMQNYKNHIRLQTDKEVIEIKIILNGRRDGKYTRSEKDIAEAWGELTGHEEVNIYDNFFDMGMESIQATILAGKLRKNYRINLTDIFKYPCIESLAQHVEYTYNNLKSRLNQIDDMMSSQNITDSQFQDKLNIELSEYRIRNQVYKELDVTEKIQYNNILLTGVTGYLGMYILYELINNTNSNIYVIIRKKNAVSTEERLKNKFKYYFDENEYNKHRKRIFVIDGDLSEPNLGISKDDYVSLSNRIDCIINAAANTKHFGSYEDFYKANIVSTRNLLDFSKNGIMKDFNHISTIGVAECKLNSSQSHLFSEYDKDFQSNVENFYVKSKSEAELLVVKAGEEGLNTNIFRVSNIAFDSKNGKFQENIDENAVYLIIRALLKIGYIPDCNLPVDFSFVDYVGKSIVLLFNVKSLRNEIYHITNPHSVDLAQLITQYKELNINLMSSRDFVNYIYSNYENENLSRYIQDLIVHLGINFNFLEHNQLDSRIHVESEKTNFILNKLGFEWANINYSHFKKMIMHCREVGFI